MRDRQASLRKYTILPKCGIAMSDNGSVIRGRAACGMIMVYSVVHLAQRAAYWFFLEK